MSRSNHVLVASAKPLTTRWDVFKRSNSTTTINPPNDGKSNWVTGKVTGGTSTWGISAGNAYYTGSEGNLVATSVLETGFSNGFLEVTPTVIDTNFGVIGRYQDEYNFIAGVYNNGYFQVFECVAGTLTQLGSSVAVSLSTYLPIRLWIDSSNVIKFYQYSTIIISTSSTKFTTATKWGIFARTPTARFWRFKVRPL